MISDLQPPPHSARIEQAVLGALLLDGRIIDFLADEVIPEDFYNVRHQEIYGQALNCHKLGIEIDLITLSAHLEKEGKLEEIGGRSYLVDLSNTVPTAANVQHYVKQLKEKSLYRKVIEICDDTARYCRTEEMSGEEILNYLEAQLSHLSGHIKLGKPKFIGEVLSSFVTDIDNGLLSSDFHGIKTGFADIDSIVGGLQKSDMVIIAGRPSMGKTSLLLKMLIHFACNLKIPVAMLSLESSQMQILERLLSILAKIQSHHFRKRKIPEEFNQQFNRAVGLLGPAPFHIEDSGAPTIQQIRALARHLKRKHKIEVLAIDYLQLIRPGERTESKNEAVGLIAQGLKAVAKELDITVIALSQLSRKSEDRPGKRPELSDLRESGEIEQVADLVLMLHRPEFYGIQKFHDDQLAAGLAEVRILKHRNGPTGDLKLRFFKEFTEFESLADEVPF